jgi:hypothetical protein
MLADLKHITQRSETGLLFTRDPQHVSIEIAAKMPTSDGTRACLHPIHNELIVSNAQAPGITYVLYRNA